VQQVAIDIGGKVIAWILLDHAPGFFLAALKSCMLARALTTFHSNSGALGLSGKRATASLANCSDRGGPTPPGHATSPSRSLVEPLAGVGLRGFSQPGSATKAEATAGETSSRVRWAGWIAAATGSCARAVPTSVACPVGRNAKQEPQRKRRERSHKSMRLGHEILWDQIYLA